VCLLADAQLEIMNRLLSSLVVKPENMRRNLERASGFLCSEALLMRLSEPMGRDRAHALVKEICDSARDRARSLREVALESPEVRRHLSAGAVESCLAPERYLGETRKIVRRVLASYRKRRKTRRLS
jgi:adenylosuccinate lyase